MMGVEEALRQFDSNAAALGRRSRAWTPFVSWRRELHQMLVEIFLESCDRLDVQVLVECGAHEAETSTRFVAEHPTRHAVAVEANPFTFRSKTAAARSEHVTVLNAGVSSSPGRSVFRIPNRKGVAEPTPGSGSFLPRTLGDPQLLEVEVDLITVDQIVHGALGERPLALWIDVEGYSREVLKGGEKTLASPNLLLCFIEVEEDPFWSGQGLVPEIITKLDAHGFVPVARDAEYYSQYNLLFVRKEHVASIEDVVAEYWRRVLPSTPRQRLSYWWRKTSPHRHPIMATKNLAIRLLGADRYRSLSSRMNRGR